MGRRDDQPDEFEEMVRYGTVVSRDLATGRVVVKVGDVETDQIRWLERRSGETKTWSPPSEGEQLLLLCPSGEIAGAIALGGVSSTANPHPGNSERELVKFNDDAVLAYDPVAHKLDVTLPDGATIVVRSTGGVSIDCTEGGLTITAPDGGVTIDASSGGVSITGDVTVDGTIDATGDITSDADVKAGAISLKTHKHGGVAAGGAQTGTPV